MSDQYLNWKPNKIWYWFVFRFGGWLFRVVCKRTILGLENVPKSGPVILAPIHLSHLDPPLIGTSVPRLMRTMAKDSLFKGIFAVIIRSVGAFPVKRGENDPESLRIAMNTLAKGDVLVLFPEGTRNNGTHLGEIQSGFAMLAERTKAPVIPVGINGTQHALGVGQAIFRPAKITVSFGKPILYADLGVTGKAGRAEFKKLISNLLVKECETCGLYLKTSEDTTTPTSNPVES